ncbi:hypothetical protein [Megasphaera lornae]|uniref:Uncharacterized protein n=1 Tax=Megasphaera lornae TaxID=1000568 RepID=D3LSS3_9FIRM|nr:hypothetical protein [Megasphaera genomosp. type_1]EFD94707.1 hypothetical protein HMPREF0889_1446 [Megasphaera genomosp. type_1 str. 28L]
MIRVQGDGRQQVCSVRQKPGRLLLDGLSRCIGCGSAESRG